MEPRISIVTPSYNQENFIAKTIESVLYQNYKNLEYIIIDGKSDDGSSAIINTYENKLAFHVSEKDDGQYDAINKGFSNSTGEIMGWINSDDLHLPWTLSLVSKIFSTFSEIEWITTRHPMVVDRDGVLINLSKIPSFSEHAFLCGDNLPSCGWPASGFIQQESTFWRRSLWDKAGGYINNSYKYAGDFELWARFFQYAELFAVDSPISCFRRHEAQKTSENFIAYKNEALEIFKNYNGQSPAKIYQLFRLLFCSKDFTNKERLSFQKLFYKPAPMVSYNWQKSAWQLSSY